MLKLKKLLACWHKLEHFNPAILPNENNLTKLDSYILEPWSGQTVDFSKKETVVYTIYFGVHPLTTINDFVRDFFKEQDNNPNKSEDLYFFASIKLDASGMYIKNTLGVSTLPWALGQIEKGKLKTDNWSEKFKLLLDDILKEAQPFFKDDSKNDEYSEDIKQSISLDNLFSLEKLLLNKIGWSVKLPSSIFIEKNKKNLSKQEQDKRVVFSQSNIINSFYSEDIERVIHSFNDLSKFSAVNKYLKGNINDYGERIDLQNNVEYIRKVLSPKNFPDACWPSAYSLNLMQQFAVNNIVSQCQEKDFTENLFSVNGPPGTGKTTLLRHAIAGIISERAKKLSEFKDPKEAFISGGEVEVDNSNFVHNIVYPKNIISNGGIVIASNNNVAVQNISQELPQKEAIKPFEDEISYFKSVADNALPDQDHWGVFSAILGNKKNKTKFIDSYWEKWHEGKLEKKGLQVYLKENKYRGIREWNDVKVRFKNKLKEVEQEKERLYRIERLSVKQDDLFDKQDVLLKEFEVLTASVKELKKEHKDISIKITKYEGRKLKASERIKFIKSTKPSFFLFWLQSSKRKKYYYDLNEARNKENNVLKKITEFKKRREVFEKEIDKKETTLVQKNSDIKLVTKEVNLITSSKNKLKQNYADKGYWDNIDTKEVQDSCPWYSDKLQSLQIDVFRLSLELNEVFLLTANANKDMISKTLTCFFRYLKGGVKPTKKQIEQLWATFFLVVPVVSTTFASVFRMFETVGSEKLPWLFIDEAGQATPQSALGAIWRSKNVVVVGDPFQIEPVNLIPELIVKKIREHYGLSANELNALMSVQIASDRINSKGVNVTDSQGNEVWIGAPLKVHRRCINPMFAIANAIAYDNSMYLSTPRPDSLPLLIENSFIHTQGIVSGRHYCVRQAEVICQLIKNEIQNQGVLPDVFVISPFKEIEVELRKYFKKNIEFPYQGKTQKESKMEFSKWIDKRVGTVHTFQGKQADGVFFCLGLDERTQGAATWASFKPNILNVALTRAKYKFVAVGDKNIWLNQPYFKLLSKLENVPELN
ncbi:AAA domain-containing protein [Tenacibaculum xiamenense]|uniref:AAA domain-containing protein n=1 Tax=Tenacibaculum xiamenense TaxID=1261553 RepID=UPI0038943B44